MLAFLLLLSALAVALPRGAAAHPELERADPPPDGLLGAPPRQLDLWLSETVDQGAGSPTLQLLDEDGREVPLGGLSVATDDPRHIRAEFAEPLGFGTYTVLWSARSADDGHTLSGSYAFRVGSGRAPGAATVQGEQPRPWAVVTRWLTFLGAALAASGFLFGPVVLAGRDDPDRAARRRLIAILAGAAVALLASLAEPVLQTVAPVGGAARPALADAIWGLPRGWWLRPIGALAAIGCAVVMLRATRLGRPTPGVLSGAGAALSLVALLGLSFTSHAAARADWRVPAVASSVLHGWAVALWVGGLAHLALRRRGLNRDELKGDDAVAVLDPVRRFSRVALGLVVVGVVTGAVNAGFVLPAVRSLWRTTYGDILLVKIAVLVPALALATFHRTALRRAMARAGNLFRTTIRVEAALVLLVAVGGSLMALSASPVVRAGNARLVDLEVPVATEPGRDLSIRLQVAPARPGENSVRLLVADASGAPVGGDRLLTPPLLHFVSLNEPVEQRGVVTTADEAGAFAVDGVQLSLDGWWRVEATISRPGQPVARVPFYLMLPDPNVNGQNAPPIPDAAPEATALFERGLIGLTSPRSVRFDQRLSGGTGTAVESSHAVTAGGDGRPPASALFAAEFEAIRVGEVQWVREPPAQTWTEREAAPVYLPADWGKDYADATGFRLGRIEEVEGERCQIVSFVVPAAGDRSVWYAWWVGLESGHVRRETMVARGHYMLYRFYDFDAPFTIEPPANVAFGTLAATPAATPETRP